MTNVVDLPVITSLEIPSERILQKAIDAEISGAVVLGYDANGDFYFASSNADGGDILWLLEMTKKRLLEIGDS